MRRGSLQPHVRAHRPREGLLAVACRGTTHFYGDDCVGGHNRCQGFVTEPDVHYHAHDLPLCVNEGVRLVDGRWFCEDHAQAVEARK